MIRFLDKKTLLVFHRDQLERNGGASGIRDEGLLESALAQLRAGYDRVYVHEDVYHMASAPGYHLCRHHPFYDGNKRTALIAMYLFLYVNGYQLVADKKSFYAIMIDLASGRVSKEEVIDYLKKHSRKS